MKKAAIFDLDGLLIDSEILWEEAQLTIFHAMDIPLKREETYAVKGLKIIDSIAYLRKIHPWENRSTESVVTAVVDEVERLIKTKGRAMPGAKDALKLCKENKMKIALASSSDWRLIRAAIEHLKIEYFFEKIVSGEDEIYGKPHPNIFLRAAKALDCEPINCVVFEDSLHGVVAAKAARMKAIAVPDQTQIDNPKFAIADLILPSLEKLVFSDLG